MMKTNLQFFADPNPEPKPNDNVAWFMLGGI
ncbi:hypothetical protein FAM21731_02674 (plasmid) [Lentilactobacillus parabuchneri]|nr:hypothetical protein FAM21731_02674 [Lentilactobacillus parabuchneri]ORN00004.1 hypothetical protein FAM21829_02673 [Lentilactobacillus parabuchneri]